MIDKYNLPQELLKANEKFIDENGDLKPCLFGSSALGNPVNNNGSRVTMNTAHIKQLMDPKKPEFPNYASGTENIMGEYSDGYEKTIGNYRIIRKIEKFKDIINGDVNIYLLFVWDIDNNIYRVISREPVVNLSENFGYEINNDVIDSFSESDIIPKDIVLSRASAYDEFMNYRYGVNANIIFSDTEGSSEDAVEITDTLQEKMKYSEITTVHVAVNSNQFLSGIFVDDDDTDYKTLADINAPNDTHIICALKTLHKNQLLVDFTDEKLKKISAFDKVYYGNGKILDIELYVNDELEDNIFNKKLITLVNSQRLYYEEIYNITKEIIESGEKYEQDISYLNRRASDFIVNDGSKWKSSTAIFKNIMFSVTVLAIKTPTVGNKIAGRHGNKMIISKVVGPDDYHYTEDGRLIEMYASINGLSNRTIAGPLLESACTFIHAVTAEIISETKSIEEKETIFFDVMSTINPKQMDMLIENKYKYYSLEEKEAFFNNLGEHGENMISFYNLLDRSEPMFHRFRRIMDKYKYEPYKIFTKNNYGEIVECINKVYLGKMYTMILKQDAKRGFSGRACGAINRKGLPERSHGNKVHIKQYSDTAVKVGEYEKLNSFIVLRPQQMALFDACYRTSIQGREFLAQNIFANGELEMPYKFKNRAVEMFKPILFYLGFKYDLVRDADMFKVLDDNQIKYEEFDDGEVAIGTERDIYLAKIKFDIRVKTMAEKLLVDNNDLDKIIEDELEDRQYVIGTKSTDNIVTAIASTMNDLNNLGGI